MRDDTLHHTTLPDHPLYTNTAPATGYIQRTSSDRPCTPVIKRGRNNDNVNVRKNPVPFIVIQLLDSLRLIYIAGSGPTRTRIPALYKYYGKGIRVWTQTNVKCFCTVLCSYRVWNPSPSPSPNPSPAM